MISTSTIGNPFYAARNLPSVECRHGYKPVRVPLSYCTAYSGEALLA